LRLEDIQQHRRTSQGDVNALGSGPTILLVDDERLIRDLLRRRLEADGYAVIDEADNAKTAVALAYVHQPDLVVLDVLMPGLSGIEVIRALRDVSQDLQVIVYTALDAPSITTAAQAAGAAAVVDKADGHTKLLGLIATITAARSSERRRHH
jgi:DNA-binding NarL/FixJ family response regulator